MSNGEAIQRVLAALERAGSKWRHQGGGYAAQCPAHDDHDPSLSITWSQSKGGHGGLVLLCCHAGCLNEDVVTALGLRFDDLYDDPISPGLRGSIREFAYLSGSRQVVGVVQRRATTDDGKKTFRPLTMNSNGQWSQESSEELKATPYRLPELVAALDRGETVWVTEGERDVDTLAANGITATCNAGGAGKWTDAHAKWLTGAHVIVCRDRDVAGRKHGDRVMATLVDIAASVRLVEPADEHNDITDHLTAGRGVDEVVELRVWIAKDSEDESPEAIAERMYQREVAHELRRMKVREDAQQLFKAEQQNAPITESDRFVTGGSFIHDAPDHVPAIWGQGDDVLWSQGEPLIITGPTGVGKTTLGGQVIAARIGLLDEVLGYPVADGRRVLYLAMDRPRQIARALGRLMRSYPKSVLDEKVIFWRGPPPADLARQPSLLLELCRRANADTVVLDSLKDAAVNLSDEEVGQGLNNAMQLCIASDIEVMAYHHQTKRGNGGISKPNTIADVYGAVWITAGVGSVILLWGDAGDPLVELSHLKQPAGEVGPLHLSHDQQAGTLTIVPSADVFSLLLAWPRTAREVATILFGENPSEAKVEKARRKIVKLMDKGLAVRLSDPTSGGSTVSAKGGGEGARYGAAAGAGSVHARPTDRSTSVHVDHGKTASSQVDRSTRQNPTDRSTLSVHDRSTSVHEKTVSAGRSVHASLHADFEPPPPPTPYAPPLRGARGGRGGDHENRPPMADLDTWPVIPTAAELNGDSRGHLNCERCGGPTNKLVHGECPSCAWQQDPCQ